MAKHVPLLSFADEVVEKLCALVPDALENGEATAVHQCRVATRRMKSALDVFEPITSRSHHKEFSKVLKNLRHSLGPVRDLDVMVDNLKSLRKGRDTHAPDWAIGKLSANRNELLAMKLSRVDAAKVLAKLGAWWGVKQEWLDAGDGLDCLISESLHLQLDRFIEHADGLAAQANAQELGQRIDPHQLRIAGKELRYVLEIAVAGGHKLPGVVTRSFKKMQDKLGLWHDYVVLADQLLRLSLKSCVGHYDVKLQVGLLGLIKTALERSQKQLMDFGKIWSARGEELATTIRHAFPLTHVVSISETGLGPIGLEISAGKLEEIPVDESSAA